MVYFKTEEAMLYLLLLAKYTVLSVIYEDIFQSNIITRSILFSKQCLLHCDSCTVQGAGELSPGHVPVTRSKTTA